MVGSKRFIGLLKRRAREEPGLLEIAALESRGRLVVQLFPLRLARARGNRRKQQESRYRQRAGRGSGVAGQELWNSGSTWRPSSRVSSAS